VIQIDGVPQGHAIQDESERAELVFHPVVGRPGTPRPCGRGTPCGPVGFQNPVTLVDLAGRGAASNGRA
jgi:hypothetical protein